MHKRNTPLVTIITPVYNHEAYLDEYLLSIINQTYQNIELIIIDDASPDKSQMKIEQWLPELHKRFVNVIYIPRKENKGLIFNNNEGLSIAKGEYINVFYSDDVMLPTNIEEKVIYLEKYPECAMVYSDAYLGVDIKIHNHKISEKGTHLEGHIFKSLVDQGNFIPSATVLIRKKVLTEVGGYSSDYMFDDYPMWLKVSYLHKIGYIKQALIYYRLSPGSLSRGVENYKSLIKSQKRLLNDVHEQHGIDIETGLQNTYKMAAIFFLQNDRSLYKHYRKKITDTDWKIIAADILYYSRINPRSIEFVNHFRKRVTH